MNHAESLEMLAEQKRRPTQVAQIVPAPYSLPYDETIRNVIRYRGVDCLFEWARVWVQEGKDRVD